MLSTESASALSESPEGAGTRLQTVRHAALLGPVITAVGYFAAAEVGAALAFPLAPVSAFWAPNALLFAALLLAPTRTWWMYFAAVLPLHVLAQLESTPLLQIAIQYVVNCAEAWIGATALLRYEQRPVRLDSLGAMSNFIVIGGIVAPFVTSVAMVGAFVAAGLTKEVWLTVIARTITNTFATMALVPLILHAAHWHTVRLKPISGRRALEAMAVAAALVAVCLYVFVSPSAHDANGSALLYAPLPFLILATVRFGLTGVCGSVLLVGALATWGVLHDAGPFVSHSPVQNALATVMFLNVTCAPLLLLASVLGERARVVTALGRSQSLHRAVMASLRDQIAVLDSSGTVIDANASWLEAADCEGAKGARIGTNYLNAVTAAAARGEPSSVALRDALVAVLTGADERRDIELACTDRDGVRWFEHSIEALQHPQRGAVITRSDITARKRAEMEVEDQRQQLTHLGRAAMLGEMSGAIAHEIRQPLTAMLSNAEAAVSLLSSSTIDREALEETLADIISANLRAANVMQRVQSMLRKTEQPRTELQVNELVKDCLVLARADLIRRHVEVVLNLSEPALIVNADRVQIQQVLLNLIANACDAMTDVPRHDRGMTIAARCDDADQVVISVIDRGTGIARDQVEKIFEPFVTSKPHGLGLGLSICRTIIEAHGGKLWAEMLPVGAALHFSLPSGAH